MSKAGTDAAPAVEGLKKALSDKDPEIRYYVIKALSEIGPDAASALPQLKQSLRDPDIRVREMAASAARKIERPRVASKGA